MLNPFDTYSQRIVTKPADIQKEMVISAYLDQTTDYRNLQVPIAEMSKDFIQNHNVRIDWGDGQTTEIEAGRTIPQNMITHRYSSNGRKTITITSEDGGIDCWWGIGSYYYYVSSKSYPCYLITSKLRYETPLLRVDNQSRLALGTYDSNIEYIHPYLFKNNSHITELNIYLYNYSYTDDETYEGNSFVLERNILLDLPNLNKLQNWGDFINAEHDFNKDDLFINNKKLQFLNSIGNYYNFADKRFPNILKNCPELREVTRSVKFPYASTYNRNQIHTIPEDLFRNCPKLYRASGLFSDSVTNLDATNISFTKGGFFAPNWEPEEEVNFEGMFCNKVANTLNKSNATEFVDTIKSLGITYNCDSALYNQTGMIGYSSIPSAFKTNPY